MSNIIITSDWHVHNYKMFNKGDKRLLDIINFIKWLFKLCNKNDIHYIFFAGDLFNEFEYISLKDLNYTYLAFKEMFGLYPDIKFYYIYGNHDIAEASHLDKEPVNAYTIFTESFPDNFINLYGKIVKINNVNITGIPYLSDNKELYSAISELSKSLSGTNNILLTHQMLSNDIPISNDFDMTDPIFNPFKYVFNGHVHTHEELSAKFINIGSPYHKDLNDEGQSKYIIIFDTQFAVYDVYETTNKLPRIIRKTVGTEITEEEKDDFIIYENPVIKKDEEIDSEKFDPRLNYEELIKNYWQEVSDDPELLNIAIKLIKKADV